MTWWMVLLLVLAVLALIGCIPVGVDAAYSPDGIFVSAKLGPFRLQILPKKLKKPGKATKSAKAAAPTVEKSDAAASDAPKKSLSLPGGMDGILRIAQLAVDVLGDLRRKLRVDELTVRVTIGGDPADAAMAYGRAWALTGALMPLLECVFVIKKRDIRPVLDYNENKMSVSARLVLTITVGRALALALRAGVGFLRLLHETKKGGAAV